MAVVRSRFGFFGMAALLLVLVLTACSGGPIEPSWGNISLLDNNILVTFSQTLVQVNPVDGSVVNLYDSNGNVRTDPNTNQARRWEINSNSATMRFYQAPLIIDENTLLAPSYDRKFFTIDRALATFNDTTGIELPDYIAGDVLREGDTIYVPLSEQGVLALNADDYSQIWRFTTERGVWAQPLLHEGVLYITSMDHHIYAVDAETGAEIWRLDLGGAIPDTALLYEDHLYIGTFARQIVKVSLDGAVVASYSTADWVWGTPVVANNTLYAADLVGNVYALSLDADGFTELWTRKVAERAIRPSLIVYEDRLIAGSTDRFVYWLNLDTGETIVRREVLSEVEADMLLVEPSEQVQIGETLLLVNTMSRDNLLYAFPADGDSEARWKYPR